MLRYPTDIRQRAKRFAVDVYGLSKDIRQRYPALRNACEQLMDAATSVGANLAESQGLNSRKELAARYAIALKESKESLFWLEFLATAETSLQDQIQPFLAECREFIAMTTTALKKLRP